jgi:gamma-tubulin complex component 2
MRDLLLQDYLVLVAQLEEQFASSPSFSLQRFYVYVQPMLHRFFLGHTLAMDLMATPADPEASGDLDEADASKDEDDDDDDRFGGGAALREAMKAMNGGDSSGKTGGWAAGGTVKGGEVLAVIDERLQRTSG